MKETKIVNQIKLIIMFCAMCITICLFGAEAKAATSGTIPCSEGAVSWTLDANGVLTFSGNGKTNMVQKYGYEAWTSYWTKMELNSSDVLSVKTQSTTGIYLDTCNCMFENFTNCTSIDLSGFRTDYVTNMSGMFYNCASLTGLDLSLFNTSQVTSMSSMFYNCASLTELDLSLFNTSQVIYMGSMFNSCTSLKELDLSGFNTSQATSMYRMFYNCTALEKLDVSSFGKSQVKRMDEIFYNCTSLKELDLSNFDTSKIDNMRHMFYNCTSLVKLDVSGFDTSQVKDMACMFDSCASLKELDISGFDTSRVTDMRCMFEGCASLTKVNVSGIDVSKVKYVNNMFEGCASLKELDLSKFRTGQLVFVSEMFQGCASLTELDISGFDTSKVHDMSSMFEDCASLTKLNISGIDTSEATLMYDMFEGCALLTELDVSSFDTSQVTNMNGMFASCASLKELDISGFDTSQVEKMESMFDSCESLTELDVSGFNTSQLSRMGFMFYKCSSLKQLDLSNFDTSKLVSSYCIIDGCEAVELLITPNTSFTIYMPWIPDGKYWLDTEKNFYREGAEYTFNQKTEIHQVNETYNISYDTEGELINCPTSYKVTEGVSQLGTVIHPHGTFVEWCLDEACTTPITTIEVGTFGDLTLYPKLTPNTYQITYKNIDDITNKESLPTTYTYGTELTIPKAEKKCFAFKGWFWDESCTQAFPVITKKTGGDITLYAKWEESHDIDKQNGKILKPATEEETGLIQYTCKNCSYAITEEIPKIESKPEPTPDPTEDAILNNGDNDIKGSSFHLIQARADRTTKNSIRLRWNRVTGADGYMVYGNKCNPKNKYEPIETITSGDTTTFTHKNRKKGTYYKYTIYAYKLVNGKREKVAVSKTVHATTKGSKNGNAKSVKVNKTKVTLKKGKTFKLKCKEVAEKGKKVRIHRPIAYESSNTKIATVNQKGVIKGKKKGTCYVYAYAQDGVYKRIKVSVK